MKAMQICFHNLWQIGNLWFICDEMLTMLCCKLSEKNVVSFCDKFSKVPGSTANFKCLSQNKACMKFKLNLMAKSNNNCINCLNKLLLFVS